MEWEAAPGDGIGQLVEKDINREKKGLDPSKKGSNSLKKDERVIKKRDGGYKKAQGQAGTAGEFYGDAINRTAATGEESKAAGDRSRKDIEP